MMLIKKIFSKSKRIIRQSLIHKFEWKINRKLYRFIFKRNVSELMVSSVRGYCIENNLEVIYFEKSDIQKAVRQPKYFNRNAEEIINETKCCPIYVAVLLNATVLENCPYIESDGFCLDDSIEWDYNHRYSVVQGNILSINDNKVYVEKPVTEVTLKKGIYLCGYPVQNYFHMMIDIMSRIQYVDKIDKYKNYPILIDESVKNDTRNIELLKLINKYKREIIFVKKDCCYYVEELIFPAHNSWAAINLKNKETHWNDNTVSPDVINFYRKYVLKKTKKKQDKNLMIVRKTASNPRIENEKQVANFFQEKGFEIVDTNDLSFIEEVELFSKAKNIVCARGAVAANFVFCSPGTNLFLFTPYKFRSETGSANIAYHAKLNCMYVDVNITTDSPVMSDTRFKVDLNVCEQIWKYIEAAM